MNSLEALKKLFFDNKDLHVDIVLNDRNVCKIYNTIKRDLERLEKLEEFSKLCLTKYVPLDCMSPVFWNSKEEWLEDMSYDYYLYLCDEVCEYVVKDNIKLTPKEFKLVYELLKEVLGNES